jgi:hypothetical protein
VRRGLVVGSAALLVASVSVALAATLGLGTQKLGAGSTTIARCDANGFTVTPTLTGANITAVVLGDIADPGCEGAAIRVTLTNSSNTSVSTGGPTTVATDGDTAPNSQSVTVSPAVAETSVVSIRFSGVGP